MDVIYEYVDQPSFAFGGDGTLDGSGSAFMGMGIDQQKGERRRPAMEEQRQVKFKIII
jgi:hypothetical protein